MRKKIVIIDDNELFRAGLTRLIDSFDNLEVKLSISTSKFSNLVFKEKETKKYNLVILCPPFPSLEWQNVCEKSVRTFSSCPVMIFSNHFSKYTVVKAIEQGVSAYYTKSISPYSLEDIMNDLTSEEYFSGIKLEPRIKSVLRYEELIDISFTEAEEDVLKLVCQQKSSGEISDFLGISVRTVESRKRNMMVKTQSKNMIGVVMAFMKSSRYLSESQMPPGV